MAPARALAAWCDRRAAAERQAVAEGPRATARFAAVAAAAVAGLAALARDAGVGARFAAALAARLEAAAGAADSLAAGNLAGVAAQLYMVGLLDAGALFGLLAHLRVRRAPACLTLTLTLTQRAASCVPCLAHVPPWRLDEVQQRATRHTSAWVAGFQPMHALLH
jgi:hypothetical protein